jgi:hypothetical protein
VLVKRVGTDSLGFRVRLLEVQARLLHGEGLLLKYWISRLSNHKRDFNATMLTDNLEFGGLLIRKEVLFSYMKNR